MWTFGVNAACLNLANRSPMAEVDKCKTGACAPVLHFCAANFPCAWIVVPQADEKTNGLVRRRAVSQPPPPENKKAQHLLGLMSL
jgi:hypothetical protein